MKEKPNLLFLLSRLVFCAGLLSTVASTASAATNDHLQNSARGQCLNANTLLANTRDCVATDAKQIWTYNAKQQLVNANGLCLTSLLRYSPVNLSSCSTRSTQKWVYSATQKTYKNSQTSQCLNVQNSALNGTVIVSGCSNTALSQKWQFATIAPPPPPPVSWLEHDIKFNGIGIGVAAANKSLLVSLGDGFDNPANYDVTFNFQLADSGYNFAVNGSAIGNGSVYHFSGIKYGSQIPLQRYRNGILLDTYNLIFTNLPVIQLAAAEIVDEPKLPGTFRLMSGKFNQDTGVQNMGIEWRGSTSQAYPKKPYGIQIGSATDWTLAQDMKLLDMRTDSDWILDAVYRDQILVRNITSHDIFRETRGSAYIDATGVAKGQAAIKGHLAEVIQNGALYGIYVLEEKPDRKLYNLKKITVPTDANGVSQWSQVDFSNPENGSLLYKASYADGDSVFFDTLFAPTNFEQSYPKPEDVDRMGPLYDFINFVANSTDQDFVANIGNKIDIDSVVDWWILVDATHAADNVMKNFYLGKSGSNKFFMATWDHDATFGMNWNGEIDTDIIWPMIYERNNLIRRLMTLPATGFNTKLKARWNALKPTLFNQTNLVARFDNYLTEATKGGAKARNLAAWPGAGGPGAGNPELGTVSFINDFITTRFPLVDQFISDLPEN